MLDERSSVVTNLKISKESGVSEETVVIPKKLSFGKAIYRLSARVIQGFLDVFYLIRSKTGLAVHLDLKSGRILSDFEDGGTTKISIRVVAMTKS